MVDLRKLRISNFPWSQLALAILAIVLIYSALNQPAGPVTEAVGIIESWRLVESDSAPPRVIATVLLKDGARVQANVVRGVVALQGYVAHVRILRRLLSGGQTYEIYRTVPPN